MPKLTDLELGFSRDGFHWDRPDRSGFIKCSRTEGAWDRAYLHSTTGVFVVCDDELVFPYLRFPPFFLPSLSLFTPFHSNNLH